MQLISNVVDIFDPPFINILIPYMHSVESVYHPYKIFYRVLFLPCQTLSHTSQRVSPIFYNFLTTSTYYNSLISQNQPETRRKLFHLGKWVYCQFCPRYTRNLFSAESTRVWDHKSGPLISSTIHSAADSPNKWHHQQSPISQAFNRMRHDGLLQKIKRTLTPPFNKHVGDR